MHGKKTWWFPDGDLPEPTPGHPFVAHESVMVLNPNDEPAELTLTFYWEDHEPDVLGDLLVEPRRVRCIRIDKLDQIMVPFRTQYSLRLDSNVGVLAQYGRMDTASPGFALIAVPGQA